MNTTRTSHWLAAALGAILVLAVTGTVDAQQRTDSGRRAATVALRGQITAFDGSALTVKSMDGDAITVNVPKHARISSLTRVGFSDLKKGDFIASAGMRQKDGTLIAIDVRVFPAGGRHPREVYRKFRLGPESTMTNAWVESFVGDLSGRTFKVKYKGGEKTIVVPRDAPVMRQDPGTRNMLKPGAYVSIVGRKGMDGRTEAIRMAIGMNGLVPPT